MPDWLINWLFVCRSIFLLAIMHGRCSAFVLYTLKDKRTKQKKKKRRRNGRGYTLLFYSKGSHNLLFWCLLLLHWTQVWQWWQQSISPASDAHDNNNNLATTTIITDNITKRSKLLSMAVKIQQILIIMQYFPNISNNSIQRDRACVCTALLIVDSITAVMLYSWCICYHCLIISKKRMDACDKSKGGGGKKQQIGLSIW